MNREHADPRQPWNPREPVQITPEEFEEQVFDWVRASLEGSSAEVTHHAKIMGQGGQYDIDIRIRMTVLTDAVLDLFIECKHQTRAVEREEVLVLEGKLRDAGAHKGLLFSTSGFQKGAIEYATAHGIATITVIAGEWLYETKALGPTPPPPPWLETPRFAGIRVTPTEGGVHSHTILPDHLDAISEFLGQGAMKG